MAAHNVAQQENKMAKFLVGQKIVCIDATDSGSELKCGDVYEVEIKEVDYYNYCVKIAGSGQWYEGRFELYENKKETMNNSTKKPHIHAEIIKAWADGAEIEFLLISTSEWTTTTNPSWSEDYKYRVKPDLTYPETTLTGEVLHGKFHNCEDSVEASHVHVANEAIKHFIASGDMDKYIKSIK
jgi:hypothetical protein